MIIKNESEQMSGLDYFKIYPSPMLQSMFEQHVTSMSSITTYYGPFLYWLCRVIRATRAMEIRVDMGWSTYFMASAVKDEGVRRGCPSSFYGVDLVDRNNIVEKAKANSVPIDFIKKDSLDLVPGDWNNQILHIVFQDGYHSNEYVLDELEILYPYLADKGKGYWVMHDVYSHCEQVFPIVIKKYNFEYIRFFSNYLLVHLILFKEFLYRVKILMTVFKQKFKIFLFVAITFIEETVNSF